MTQPLGMKVDLKGNMKRMPLRSRNTMVWREWMPLTVIEYIPTKSNWVLDRSPSNKQRRHKQYHLIMEFLKLIMILKTFQNLKSVSTTNDLLLIKRISIKWSQTYLSVAGFTKLLDFSSWDVRVIVAFSTLIHCEPSTYPALPRGWKRWGWRGVKGSLKMHSFIKKIKKKS